MFVCRKGLWWWHLSQTKVCHIQTWWDKEFAISPGIHYKIYFIRRTTTLLPAHPLWTFLSKNSINPTNSYPWMIENKLVKWTNDCSNENTQNVYTQIKVIREQISGLSIIFSSLKSKTISYYFIAPEPFFLLSLFTHYTHTRLLRVLCFSTLSRSVWVCVCSHKCTHHLSEQQSENASLTKWHLTRSLKEVSQPHRYLSVEHFRQREQLEQRSDIYPWLWMTGWNKLWVTDILKTIYQSKNWSEWDKNISIDK